MVVVVIIAIIAGFAIPNYQKSVERAHLKTAILNLTAVHGAQQIYRAQNNTYWGTGNVSAINSNLGLNIIENGMTYTSTLGGVNFTVTAVRGGPSGAFTVTVINSMPLSTSNPGCTGTCP